MQQLKLEPSVTNGKMSSRRGTVVPNWLLILLLAMLVFFIVLSMGLMVNRVRDSRAGAEPARTNTALERCAIEVNSNTGEVVALLDRWDRTRLGGSDPVYSAGRARARHAESEKFATVEGGENGNHAL